MTLKEMKEQLETAIDAENLRFVLEALEEICYEKAEHLRTNWQDTAAAREWEKNARTINRAQRQI